MWTEKGWGRGAAVSVIAVLAFLSGCGGSGPSESGDEVEESAAVEAPAGAETAAATPMGPPITNVSDLFPEAPAKQLVLSNCTSCHAVACAVIGQRPEGRWNELAEAHREHVPGLSDEERTQIFTYLAANFGEGRPEPNVAPELIQAGCTPF